MLGSAPEAEARVVGRAAEEVEGEVFFVLPGGLAPADDDPDALCRRAELLAGQRLHEGGGTVNLSAAEWLDRWQRLDRR
jgi:hypothetical protein